MHWHKDTLEVQTRGKGLYPFTEQINACIRQWGLIEGDVFFVRAAYQCFAGDQ